MKSAIAAAALVLLTAFAAAAAGTQPVKRIEITVTPYYNAASTAGGTPQVKVGATFDALLASNRREDIVKVRDMIVAAPERVTPMTMMVLAIRLYDVDLRDDSVLWFYIAKYRYSTIAAVLDNSISGDVPGSGMSGSGVGDAIKAFAALAGPYINSYAFCDIAKQQQAETKSIDWVEQHPYAPLFMTQLPAKPGDRAANLKQAIAQLRTFAGKERAQLNDPAVIKNLRDARRQNNVEAQFCW